MSAETLENFYPTHEWLSVLADLSGTGTPCVLITVVEAKGSTPRDAGTKMVVTTDRQFGTIGGGNLEFQAIGEARRLLASAIGDTKLKDYPLGPALAQCCGGAVTVLLEPVLPPDKTLLLFGAGHVGKEVVRVLEGLSINVRWIDEREGEFPAQIPHGCRKIVALNPVGEITNAPAGAFIIIMTHSHHLDYQLVRAAMERGDFAYLGLIGSDTKRARFESKLRAEGISEDMIARLTCPIGIPAVTGKHPREIAVAVSAEILGLGLTRPKAAA
jgi:xanthine dehydrogenase accessory factor